MTRKIVSWVLVGVFAYVWWWVGYRWSYFNSPGNQWSSVYELFTLVSMVLLLRAGRVAKSGLLDGLVGVLKGIGPQVPWLVLAALVMRGAAALHTGYTWMSLDHVVHAVVATLAAVVMTALWYGALENASD